MNLIDHLYAIAEADEPITSKDLARCGVAAALLEDLGRALTLCLRQGTVVGGDYDFCEAALAEYEEKCLD